MLLCLCVGSPDPQLDFFPLLRCLVDTRTLPPASRIAFLTSFQSPLAPPMRFFFVAAT